MPYPQSVVEPSFCTLRASRSPAAAYLPARTSHRIVCPPFDPRQYATAFNQPLSFDTSSVTKMGNMFNTAAAFNQPLSFDTPSVTDMNNMFAVRSSPWPPTCSRALPCTLLAPRSPPDPSPCHASYALRSDSRQGASAFNQPLSFNTSKVIHFTDMFDVRSPLVPCPPPLVGPAPACSAVAPHPPIARPAAPRFACSPFGSAGHELLVRREQAAHPLRLGGQPTLR